jgi:hypothetical protein
LQQVSDPIHKLLIATKVIMTSDVKHCVDCLMRPHLLPVCAFTRTYDMYLVLVWKPHSNTIFAVTPLRGRNYFDFNGMTG